ncbi:MAG: DUF6789 family protein [Flavobacteriales bacterium]
MRPLSHTSPATDTQGICCITIAASGFLPVGSIVLHCLGFLSLPACLTALVIPGVLLTIVLAVQFPALGKTVLFGWIAGIIAVAVYDLSRVPYILNGWSDFIPRIGAWANNSTHPDAFIGYLWRYMGNGGGMGIAFFVLMKHFRPYGKMIQNGVLFGMFIFSCLMFVLIISEQAQEMMFKITPLSFTGSLTGHIVYGLVLGYLGKRYFAKQHATFNG